MNLEEMCRLDQPEQVAESINEIISSIGEN
jgi:hypothetical protein